RPRANARDYVLEITLVANFVVAGFSPRSSRPPPLKIQDRRRSHAAATVRMRAYKAQSAGEQVKHHVLWVVLFFTLIRNATAQIPTGTITGVVRDPSGAAIAGASIRAMSLSTGVARTAVSSEQGDYVFAVLLAGGYEGSVEASDFRRTFRVVSVEAGTTTTASFNLVIGEVDESITVDAVSPQIQYDSHVIRGLISRSQIENLPLNGRSFLE